MVEEGQSLATELQIVERSRFTSGYISPHFVTDSAKMTCTLKRARVLLHDGKIESVQALLPILDAVAKDGVSLLIVAEDVVGDALSALVLKRLRGGLRVGAVKASGYGEGSRELMEDIAALTGTSVVRDELGMKLDPIRVADLGVAESVTISRDDTILVGTRG